MMKRKTWKHIQKDVGISNKTSNKLLQRTNLSVMPFAGQKACQPAFAAEFNRYAAIENEPRVYGR